ncbi:uncharacterized protein LOC126898917 isoform X2 [Daktulosphaira vitifoliae]|uniref:uncharacterized protein LOC126898917 isoform X2 n=1 Tax=Daktulosphaira vitifoliae TaxID=58002 RepID=UPI0021AA065A|nr:uncharacterized protein LOC126898917 isoform X2 [Daktulosphaira vitifoliae]
MYALVKPGKTSSSRQRNNLQQNEIKKEPIIDPGDFSQLSDSDEDSVTEIVSKYLAKRNIESSYITKQKVTNKNVMEYINMRFVQSNFRTLGFHDPNDQNLPETWEQFLEFEEWLKELPENYQKQLKHIRFPLFCHLYLNLHSKYSIEDLSSFLKTFKYLFQSKKSISFLKELLKINETNNMNKIKSITKFRKNKYIFYTDDSCYMCFCDFLENHHIIRNVIHEWFEVNYITNSNHEKAVEEFFEKNIVEGSTSLDSNIVGEKRKLCETIAEQNSSTSKTEDSGNINHIDELNKKRVSDICSYTETDNTDKDIIKTSKDSINTNMENLLTNVKRSSSKHTKQVNKHQANELLNDSTKIKFKTIKDHECTVFKKFKNDSIISNEGNKSCPEEFQYDDKNPEKSKYLEKFASDKSSKKKKKSSRKEKMSSHSKQHSASSSKTLLEKKQLKTRIRQRIYEDRPSKRSSRISIIVGKDGNILKQYSRPKSSSKHHSKVKKMSNLKHKNINDENNSKTAENNLRRSRISSEDTTSDSNDSSPENNPYLDFINNEFNVCSRLRNKFISSTKKIQVTKIDVKNLEDDIHLCNMKQIILKNCEKCTCAMLSTNQKFVVAGSIDCKIYLWKRSNTSVHNKISIFDVYETDPNKNTDINFKRPSPKILNETFDKSTAKILYGHSGSIFELGQIPRSNILMSVSGDASMRAWDMETGHCLEVFNGHNHRIWCLDICSTSLQLATGSSDSTACLWYINYKKPLRFYSGHKDDVLCLKFHPNQLYLATGSSDKTVRLFNIIDAQCVRLLEGHGDFVNCLDFHLIDPCTLVSGDSGGGIIVWDLPSGLQKWKIYVGEITVADVKWLSNTILFASLASGIILKCDITRCYQEKSRKIPGFKTNYGRQINMVRIYDQFITIGLSGVPSVPKLKCNTAKLKKETQKQEATQINSNPLKHLFFPPGVGKMNTSFPAYQFLNSTQTPNVYQLNTQPMGYTTAIPQQQRQLNKLNNLRPPSFSTNQQLSQNSFISKSPDTNIQNTQDSPQLHKNLKNPQSNNQFNTHLVNANIQQTNQPQYRLHIANPQHAQSQSPTVFISQNSQLHSGTNVQQINVPVQSSSILVSQQSQPTTSLQSLNSQQNTSNILISQFSPQENINIQQQSCKNSSSNSSLQNKNIQKLLSSDINVPCSSPFDNSLTHQQNIVLPDKQIMYYSSTAEIDHQRLRKAVFAQIERQNKKKTLNDQITSSNTLNRTTFISDATSVQPTVTCTITSTSASKIDSTSTQTIQPHQ